MLALLDGFTVMLNICAAPVHVGKLVIKLPNETGPASTTTVDVTVLVAVFITDTLFEPAFAT